MNRYRYILYTVILLLGLSMTAAAQSSGDEPEDDPFKNDPFFSKPLQEFFQSSSEDDEDEMQEEVGTRLRGLNEEGIDYDTFLEAGPYNTNLLYTQYPNLPMIHFNRVEGLFLGIKKERMQWYNDDWLLDIPSIQTHGLIGYSFAQKEWSYEIGLEKLFGRKRYMMVGAEYYNATATDDFWRVGLTETTITSMIGGYDFLDYYRQQGFGSYLLMRSKRLFEGGISFNQTQFSSMQRQSNWALFGAGERYRTNPPVEIINGIPVNTLEVSSLAFNASFNPKRLILSDFFTLSLTGLVELADPGLGNSDYNYSKYLGEITTYLRLEPGGILKYRLKMGSITGEAPNMKEFQLGGVGSLRALPYKSLSGGMPGSGHFGNQMILSNAEMQFGNPITSSNSWIDFDDFYLSLFLDSGWVHFNDQLLQNNTSFADFSEFNFDDLKHNGGIGIGSSLIRFELAWDLNETDRAPVFWVRLNPTF